MKKRTNSGFSLIEVLVVVLIIGILTSVALPQYQKSVEKSRAIKGVQALKTILSAQQVYYTTYGHYTDDLSKLDVDVTIPAGFEITGLTNRMIIIHSRNYGYSYTLNVIWKDGIGYCWARVKNAKEVSLCQSISIGDYEHDETAKRYYIF